MFKFMKALCLTIVLSIGVFAQTNSDDYKKNEYFVGYSNQQIDRGNYDTFHGFEGSYVRNVSRYFGIKGDVSGAYRKETNDIRFFDSTGVISTYRIRNRDSLYNFLGGIQVKDNSSKARFKPFGHALAGVGYARTKGKSAVCTSGSCLGVNLTQTFSTSSSGFAAALGGGLDIKINDRFDFRAIQVDYNPVRSFGQFDHNVRFGIGIVIK